MKNTNEQLGNQRVKQWFFTEVHLLADKLVLVVVIHPLGGSRANWHHTPNPQLGARQPIQDGDSQATSNPLAMPFVISHGAGSKTPHNPSIRARVQAPPLLNDHQVPLKSMYLDALNLTKTWTSSSNVSERCGRMLSRVYDFKNV